MTANKILLLGSNGQLGYESRIYLPALGTVVALDFPEIDFADADALRRVVRETRPTVIVNAAAYTAVDKAESDEAKAHLINAAAPAVLAEEAEALAAIFVHYSTDYVFDGGKTSPYFEEDAANPLSVYGRTKRDGELAAMGCSRHLIFRTSWVVGAHGANFIFTMLRLAAERDALKVVGDQFGAPTSAALLASVTAKILGQMDIVPAEDPRWGLYHLVASGETSWHGLACHVIARAAAKGLPLKARPESVELISAANYPTPAKRPQNSRLDTAKLRNAFGIEIPDWTAGVNDAIDRIVEAKLHAS